MAGTCLHGRIRGPLFPAIPAHSGHPHTRLVYGMVHKMAPKLAVLVLGRFRYSYITIPSLFMLSIITTFCFLVHGIGKYFRSFALNPIQPIADSCPHAPYTIFQSLPPRRPLFRNKGACYYTLFSYSDGQPSRMRSK